MERRREHGLASELRELSQGLATALGEAARLQPVETGPTPRERVFQTDHFALYRYRGASRPDGRTAPILIVYSLINRPYLLDLHTRRSLIARLVEAGLDVYLIDWADPEPADRYLSLEDYICGFIGEAQRWILNEHRITTTSLLGVCQGGTLAACYAALYPDRVRNLVALATPIDFGHPANALARMVRKLDVDTLVDVSGNISSDELNAAFVSLSPFRLLSQRYVDLAGLAGNVPAIEDFLRMERWMYDSPDQAGEAFREFIKGCYKNNDLIRNQLVLGSRRVELSRLNMPILNVYADADHLVTVDSARALGQYGRSPDYEEIAFPGGHLGVFVSGNAARELHPRIARWLLAR